MFITCFFFLYLFVKDECMQWALFTEFILFPGVEEVLSAEKLVITHDP